MTALLKIKPEFVERLIDVQASPDKRCLPIQKVGIKDLSYPVVFEDKQGSQQTKASCSLYVSLAADQRGTHMSRFIALMNDHYQKFKGRKIVGFGVAELKDSKVR